MYCSAILAKERQETMDAESPQQHCLLCSELCQAARGAGPHSSQISFLDKNLDVLELVKLTQEALSQDKVVVVRGYVNTVHMGFSSTLRI